mmetsp:Transcript_32499/g.56204  ORF Transcript_32499/g.56204 Transcript_32499/m.56204 type:complete len:395 (-) Transcript_32499:4522-5706(-)|eukprot:CAMPEP_0204897794 /NCGR_PEP_ID=MMETSP1397-20131031/931_1 /ASSEMBLY_ACC=CAM_ASM_000891 /TAXON_ID=49980 /ORGANISM="Climacostomum Climacostomum virens, Strain Stock W-24" /LENGTH=394 /DNA_ID=CAMNT_0052065571 /DNA_START=134 /DNA_END=1321 /DNA_ORIENTATION=+
MSDHPSEDLDMIEEPGEVEIPDIPVAPGGSIFANYVHDVANGGLIYIDRETISKQRRVLKHFIKKIGANIIRGKSPMSVSFPVTIFQPISLLQKLIETFGYAPIFLERAGQATGVDRFKQVLAFAIATLHIPIEQKKPFNPILGETLQGQLGHCPIYAEQTSHHPPVSHFQILGQNFLLQGYHEYQASTSANSVKARQVGMTEIRFADGSILLSFPFVSLSGTMLGKRTFNWEGTLTIIDRQNRLFAELQFNPDKKGKFSKLFSRQKTPSDFFRGSIVRVKPTHPMMTAEGLNAILHDGKNPQKVKSSEVIETVCECTGSWPAYLEIAKRRFWSIEDCSRATYVGISSMLPSDSSYRSDLICLKRGDEDSAQAEKDRLEDLQRHDRKLRETTRA